MQKRTYAINIGEFQGFILYDQAQAHSAEELIANPIVEGIRHEFDFELDNIPVGYNNLLIRSGEHQILVDAGIRRPVGELWMGLEALKISPGDIDRIVITHSDRDHIGGILDEAGEISFPNAKYVMLEDSWRYWSTQARRAELTRLNQWTEEKTEFAWETYAKIQGLIQFVKPGEAFRPGFKLFPAPGHRYDHSILEVTSSGERLIHIADAVAQPLFMIDREWYSTYDANPVQAVETKTRLLDRCASESALVFGSHFPFPGLGHIQKVDEHWRWLPIQAG